MITLEELASNEIIKAEYKKSFLLNILRKMVGKMKKEPAYNKRVRTLFKESKNKTITIQGLVQQEYQIELLKEEADTLCTWIEAFLKKNDKRKGFTLEFKKKLCEKQNGKCMVCDEPLGDDYSKIHVDHIIPWTLVGDELEDNYQCLCETCNESKSSHTDYIFKNLLKLN